jgi:replication factor A1
MIHKVDSNVFFNCILKAWTDQESQCNPLVIQCREKTQDAAIFLFTVGKRVIGQFPIPTTILQGTNQLASYMRIMKIRSASKNTGREAINLKIKNLKAGMKRVNLEAKVLEIPKSKAVITNYGEMAYVSNVLVADDTGSIRMSLWNNQITLISQGDVIQIKNGSVTRFRGERQLRIGRNGSFNVIT